VTPDGRHDYNICYQVRGEETERARRLCGGLRGGRSSRAETIRNLETTLFFASVWGVSVFVIVSIKDEREGKKTKANETGRDVSTDGTVSNITFSLWHSLPSAIWMPHSCRNCDRKTCWCLCAREREHYSEKKTEDFWIASVWNRIRLCDCVDAWDVRTFKMRFPFHKRCFCRMTRKYFCMASCKISS
jgi:hypothetical protein